MTTRTLITALVALTVVTGVSAQYQSRTEKPKLEPVTLAVTGMT